MKNWHYSADGQQHGPFAIDDLRSMLDRREILPTAIVWEDAATERRTAAEVLGVPAVRPVQSATAPRRPESTRASFFYISTGMFVVLMIASAGLFSVYWMYQNWRYLRDHGRRGISPFWRSMFSVIWVYDLFSSIKDHPESLATRVRSYSAGAAAIGYIVAVLVSNALAASDSLVWLSVAVSFLGVACMLPVQKFIARVNTNTSPGKPQSATGAGLVVIVAAGALLGAFAVIGTFLGD